MDQEHKNATILFSDIEGYTSMMQENEQDAIAVVNRYRKILEETVAAYGGNVQQYYGDGSITIFETPVDALQCAYELQKQFMDAPKIPLRIGIHYGKVIFHNRKLFGDTVNLSSRIESIGQPGSVLISRQVVEALPETHSFQFLSLGVFKFKNVAREMEVYALDRAPLIIPDRSNLKGKLAPPTTSGARNIFLGLTAVLLIILGLWYFNRPTLPFVTPMNEAEINRSVAVMPFVQKVPDSSQAYLGEGLAEELLNKLAQEPQLRVTSRASSFSFADTEVDLGTVAQKLGVKYVLEGSFAKTNDSLRINTQLVDAQLDQTVWAKTWMGGLENIFALQDEIADSVKQVLRVNMPSSRLSATTDPQAYTLFLQAKHIGALGNVESLARSVDMIQEVLEIDQSYAPAWGYLSYLYNRQANIGAVPLKEGQQKAHQAALKALSIDSTSAQAFCTLSSQAIYYYWDFNTAKTYVHKALDLEPGSLAGLKLASNLAFCLGEVEQAIQMDQKAISLDPISAKNHFDLAYGHFFAGNGAEAERITRQGMDLSPNFLGGYYLLSLALLQQGQNQQALEAAKNEPYEILRTQAQALVFTALQSADSADWYLQDIKRQFATVAPYQVAQVYAFQDQPDSAFRWLDLSYQFRDGGLVHAQVDPFMKPLHEDYRWEELMEKMGFPEPVVYKD